MLPPSEGRVRSGAQQEGSPRAAAQQAGGSQQGAALHQLLGPFRHLEQVRHAQLILQNRSDMNRPKKDRPEIFFKQPYIVEICPQNELGVCIACSCLNFSCNYSNRL